MDMSKWSATYINDPINDFKLSLELRFNEKIVGVIKQGKNGLELRWYPHDNNLTITVESLCEILNEAKKNLNEDVE